LLISKSLLWDYGHFTHDRRVRYPSAAWVAECKQKKREQPLGFCGPEPQIAGALQQMVICDTPDVACAAVSILLVRRPGERLRAGGLSVQAR
jgi:hypothetical protein